jgi:hypothetical protein
MKNNKERLDAFLSQVNQKDLKFRHIMPEGALQWYLSERCHSPDSWTYLWKDDSKKAEYYHIAAHIRRVIDFLSHDNYEIGLMEDRPGVEVELYDKVHWEVKVGYAVLLENFMTGQEQDILIRERKVVNAFAHFFEELWNTRRYVNTDKEHVLKRLKDCAKEADELCCTSMPKAL